MTTALFLWALLSLKSSAFTAQITLQPLYDEAAQAALQFSTPQDVDDYHSVRCTPDWTFVDAQGQRHAWNDMRASSIAALENPHDWLFARIQKVLSVKADNVVVLVDETAVKNTVGETTSYRDTWVKAGDTWKLQTREQVGAPRSAPYKPF